jgi:CO dehydrogenase nickel-insertion accessory protein CooC1
MILLTDHPPRILCFTGEGGVGKTSTAIAKAISFADRGKRVLLVSTEPASNLDEGLGVKLTSTPTAVPMVPRLSAMNVDPVEATKQYRERMVGPYRGVLPAAAVALRSTELTTTELGVNNLLLVLNGVFHAAHVEDPANERHAHTALKPPVACWQWWPPPGSLTLRNACEVDRI